MTRSNMQIPKRLHTVVLVSGDAAQIWAMH